MKPRKGGLVFLIKGVSLSFLLKLELLRQVIKAKGRLGENPEALYFGRIELPSWK